VTGCKSPGQKPGDQSAAFEAAGGNQPISGEFLCKGTYSASQTAGALDAGFGPNVSSMIRIDGERLFVSDISYPVRETPHLQAFFQVARTAPTWKAGVFSGSGLREPDPKNVYQTTCRSARDVNDYNVNHCAGGSQVNMALIPQGQLNDGGKVLLARLHREFNAPHKVEKFYPVVEYTCKKSGPAFGNDPVASKVMALREFFSVRTKVGKLGVAPDGVRPLGKMTGYSAKVDGRGTASLPDYETPLGLLREQLYDYKATRNLSGLTPRDEFFAEGERNFHRQNSSLKKADSRSREYGIMSKADARAAMAKAIEEFAQVHPDTQQGVSVALTGRPTADAALQAWDALMEVEGVSIGSFGGTKGRTCDSASPIFVVIHIKGSTKLSMPLLVDKCPWANGQ
jgi:hypothetical protein